MQSVINNSTELQALRAIFVSAGYDMWFVGGCVRDALLGQSPKDIDLATSATPQEQVAIYEANGIQFIPTGLQHGTVTVVLDEPYEITSLRTESDHDGRWAKMAYTRDLTEDLSRRDLTINAIAMDFDGNIIDPFGGRADLEARRVRFVGNAAERMREDYLRILRFFRFHARIAGQAVLDEEATKAIIETRAGLSQISVERVWMEMSKIMTGPAAGVTLNSMRNLTLFEIIGMPPGSLTALSGAKRDGVTDPAAVMGLYVDDVEAAEQIAAQWKWSSAERERAVFMARNRDVSDIDRWKEMLVDGAPREWVEDLIATNGVTRDLLANWAVPKMPVQGRDLIAAGIKPGPAMGETIRMLTQVWKDSDYKTTKEELVSRVQVVEVANDP